MVISLVKTGIESRIQTADQILGRLRPVKLPYFRYHGVKGDAGAQRRINRFTFDPIEFNCKQTAHPIPSRIGDEKHLPHHLEGPRPPDRRRFFRRPGNQLAKVLNTHSAGDGVPRGHPSSCGAAGLLGRRTLTRDFLIDIAGRPCEDVVSQSKSCTSCHVIPSIPGTRPESPSTRQLSGGSLWTAGAACIATWRHGHAADAEEPRAGPSFRILGRLAELQRLRRNRERRERKKSYGASSRPPTRGFPDEPGVVVTMSTGLLPHVARRARSSAGPAAVCREDTAVS